MAISQRDIKILWALSGNCCSFPGCFNELITKETEFSILAEMAHIIAQSPGGPRGVSTLSQKERDSYENLILLCPFHHTIIDNDRNTWTVDKLHEIKLKHEARILVQSKKGSVYGPRFTTIHYLNILRILMDFAARGNNLSVDGLDLDGVYSLRGLGIHQLADILQMFGKFISTCSAHENYGINALDLATCKNITDEDTGIRIHFDQSMRTKNSRKLLSTTFVPRGNIQIDPHVYCSVGKRKACFFIDPRWVTTDTAFSVFLSGTTSRIAGLGIIKQVTNEYIIATPLAIGTIHMVNPADLANSTAREMPLL